MAWIYLHLILNHFPVILTFAGTAGCVVGAARKSRDAWTYGVISLAVAAACSIPSWITGYQAHYILENKLRVAEGVVEPHELFAEGTMWVMFPMGALAFFAWWRANQEPRRGPSPNWVRPAMLVAAAMGSIMLGVTAFLGGRIRPYAPAATPRTAADSAAAAQQSFQLIPLDTSRSGTGGANVK